MPETKAKLLSECIAKIMRPMVRLMLAHGITFREFSDLMKPVFYEVGHESIERQGKKATDSYVSTITGLHRKDITIFRTKGFDNDDGVPHKRSIGSAIVAEWVTNPLYCNNKGVPKTLPYSSHENDGVSFSSLVESISKDVRPRVHLEQMIQLEVVEVDDNDNIRLRKEAFLPAGDFTKKLEFLSRNASDHLSAATTNVLESPAPFFDRSTFYSGLSLEDIKQLRKKVDTAGMELLKTTYRQADDMKKAHGRKTLDDSRRITLGVYFYDEDEA